MTAARGGQGTVQVCTCSHPGRMHHDGLRCIASGLPAGVNVADAPDAWCPCVAFTLAGEQPGLFGLEDAP